MIKKKYFFASLCSFIICWNINNETGLIYPFNHSIDGISFNNKKIIKNFLPILLLIILYISVNVF